MKNRARQILALLLVPEPELALVFAAFGWYPILRPRIARIPSRLLRLVLKIIICTAVILALYGVLLRFLGLTADLMDAAPLFNLVLLVLAMSSARSSHVLWAASAISGPLTAVQRVCAAR